MIHLLFVGGKPGRKKTKTSQDNVGARGCFFKDMSVGWGCLWGFRDGSPPAFWKRPFKNVLENVMYLAILLVPF